MKLRRVLLALPWIVALFLAHQWFDARTQLKYLRTRLENLPAKSAAPEPATVEVPGKPRSDQSAPPEAPAQKPSLPAGLTPADVKEELDVLDPSLPPAVLAKVIAAKADRIVDRAESRKLQDPKKLREECMAKPDLGEVAAISRLTRDPQESALLDQVDMLCARDLAPCRSLTADSDPAFAWRCKRTALLEYMRSTAEGKPDRAACTLALTAGAKDPARAASELKNREDQACRLLGEALVQGDRSVCSHFGTFLTRHDTDPAEVQRECLDEFAFTGGAGACPKAEANAPLVDRQDRSTCLALASARAAVRGKSPAACGKDKLCLALFREKEACDPASRIDPKAVKEFCDRRAKSMEAEERQRYLDSLQAARLQLEGLNEAARAIFEKGGYGKGPAPYLEPMMKAMKRLAELQPK